MEIKCPRTRLKKHKLHSKLTWQTRFNWIELLLDPKDARTKQTNDVNCPATKFNFAAKWGICGFDANYHLQLIWKDWLSKTREVYQRNCSLSWQRHNCIRIDQEDEKRPSFHFQTSKRTHIYFTQIDGSKFSGRILAIIPISRHSKSFCNFVVSLHYKSWRNHSSWGTQLVCFSHQSNLLALSSGTNLLWLATSSHGSWRGGHWIKIAPKWIEIYARVYGHWWRGRFLQENDYASSGGI